MNVGKNVRRFAALGILSASGLAVVPGQVRADDGPIVDISLPVTLCGIQLGVLGTATGDCPNTPQQGPAIDINLDPVTSGEILAPVTGLLENPEILLNPEALPTILDPNTIGNVANGGNPVVNVDAPVLICGNAVAVLTDASGTCPDAPPAGPDQDSTINANVQVTTCGNGIGILTPAEGDCGGTSGTSGNDVGLPLGLSDAIPVNSVVDTLGSSIGPGRVLDVQQIINDLGLGELLDANVQVDICGNGAAVAESASAACPLSAPGTTTPGTTTPGTTTPDTTTPGTGPTTTAPGAATTAPGSATTDPGDLPGTDDGGDGNGGGNGGAGGGGGGGLLPTTGGTVLPLLGLGSLLAAAGIIARRASARRSLAA
jgi:hypothetical protein